MSMSMHSAKAGRPSKPDAFGGLLAIDVNPRVKRTIAAADAYIPFHPGDMIQGSIWMRCTKPDNILQITLGHFTEETVGITRRPPGGVAGIAASAVRNTKTKRFFDNSSLLLGQHTDFADFAAAGPDKKERAKSKSAATPSATPAGWGGVSPEVGKLYSLPFALALPTNGHAMTSVHVKTATGRATIGTYLQVTVRTVSQTVKKIIEIPVVNLVRPSNYYITPPLDHSDHFSSCLGGSFDTHLVMPKNSFTYSETAKFNASPILSSSKGNTKSNKANYKGFKVKARLKRVITFAPGHFKDSAELYSDFVTGTWHSEDLCWNFELPLQFDEDDIDVHSCQAIHTLHANWIHVKFFIEVNYKGWFQAWNVNNEIFVGNVHERAVATDILPVEYIPTTESAATNLHANADQCVLPPPALNQNIDFDAIQKAANLHTVVEIYNDDELKSDAIMAWQADMPPGSRSSVGAAVPMDNPAIQGRAAGSKWKPTVPNLESAAPNVGDVGPSPAMLAKVDVKSSDGADMFANISATKL